MQSIVSPDYADDTCLVIQGKTAKQLQYSLNSEMTKVEQWMSANRLNIYPLVKTPPIKLEVNNNQFLITSSDTFKYLGIGMIN